MEHHKRQEYCTTRPKYRQGRKLTAVKVYTVANESKHLLIFGVPKINLQREVKNFFQRQGPLEAIENVTNEMAQKMELEPFTDVFHLTYQRLEHARKAKKLCDAKSFYGGILHISYAPERETVEELKAKLDQRVREVQFRTKVNERKRQAMQQAEDADGDAESSNNKRAAR